MVPWKTVTIHMKIMFFRNHDLHRKKSKNKIKQTLLYSISSQHPLAAPYCSSKALLQCLPRLNKGPVWGKGFSFFSVLNFVIPVIIGLPKVARDCSYVWDFLEKQERRVCKDFLKYMAFSYFHRMRHLLTLLPLILWPGRQFPEAAQRLLSHFSQGQPFFQKWELTFRSSYFTPMNHFKCMATIQSYIWTLICTHVKEMLQLLYTEPENKSKAWKVFKNF